MPDYNIVCIDTYFPDENSEFVSGYSTKSLDDDDIILFTPSFFGEYPSHMVQGHNCFHERASIRIAQQMSHWRSELIQAVKSGKLVVIFLSKPEEHYRYSGTQEFSGTGRSQKTINHIEYVRKYDAVPNVSRSRPKQGRQMRIEPDAEILKSYWNEFGTLHEYFGEIEGEFKPAVKSRSGLKTVGGYHQSGDGLLLLLPELNFTDPKYEVQTEDETYWSKQAFTMGKKLISSYVKMWKSANQLDQSPPPEWIGESEYQLDKSNKIETKLNTARTYIKKKEVEIEGLKKSLRKSDSVKHLLYEKGPNLESAVRKALDLFGFDTEHYHDSNSEFDVVFTCKAGRFLGECEGRDMKAIGISKFQQLERNIHEDFARDDVDAPAKAVLFGNGYRLSSPNERGGEFTEKCLLAAKRVGAALVRTRDMFPPARYLQENPADIEYSEQCRNAILISSGEIVEFPTPPKR